MLERVIRQAVYNAVYSATFDESKANDGMEAAVQAINCLTDPTAHS